MGCDIHFYTERRLDGRWQTADTWHTDEDGEKSLYKWGEGLTRLAGPLYSSRNYDLFSILANVRNGYGFAGVDTGDGYRPISMPRGLPDDVSVEVEAASDNYGVDGHSHSYFTVAELLAYDWTQTTTRRGIVDISEFAKWRKSGRPEGWSGGIGGPGIRVFSQEQGVAAVEAALATVEAYPSGREFDWWNVRHLAVDFEGQLKVDSSPDVAVRQAAFWAHLIGSLGCLRPHFRVSWEESYASVASEFLTDTMPKLWRLGPPEDVRIVFFFDN